MMSILHKVRFKVHYWPSLTVLWFTFTFFLTYTLAVSYGHVYFYWPYISETGSFQPESCIFSQFTNVGVIFLAITLYMRYIQLKFNLSTSAINSKYNWNVISLFFGYLGCIGLDIVANFQSNSPINFVHFSGALAIFVFGSVYVVTQTKISRDLIKYGVITQYSISFLVYYIRIIISLLIFPLYITNVVFTSLATAKYNGTDVFLWTPEHEYHSLRVGSTISEWLLFFLLGGFVITYTNEFKSLQFMGISFKSKVGLSRFENQERIA